MSNEVKLDILKKAGELFYKFGIRSISIDDICKALGISKKTFYVYFSTKDELVEALLELNIEHIEKKTKEMFSRPLQEFIRDFLEQQQSNHQDIRKVPQLVFDLQKYYPNQFERFQTRIFEQQRQEMARVIVKGIQEGIFREDIDVDMTATLVAKLHNDAIRDAEKMEDGGISMLRYSHNAADVLIRGLLSKEGAEKLFNV